MKNILLILLFACSLTTVAQVPQGKKTKQNTTATPLNTSSEPKRDTFTDTPLPTAPKNNTTSAQPVSAKTVPQKKQTTTAKTRTSTSKSKPTTTSKSKQQLTKAKQNSVPVLSQQADTILLHPETEEVQVIITTNVYSPQIYIDEVYVGNDGSKSLMPGLHIVSITCEGYKPYTQPFFVDKQSKSFYFALESDKPANGYENGYEWVDLGLSVKWATYNVGAKNVNDYGALFAWGESKKKPRYKWKNYFDKNYQIFSTNSYIFPQSRYDTAGMNWGGRWRMPNWKEIDELKCKCKWVWTEENGIYGYSVTGPSGNSIFLPASGISRVYPEVKLNETRGKCAVYWCSQVVGWKSTAGCISFNASEVKTDDASRWMGASVRPVLE